MQPGSPTVWLCLAPLVQPPLRGSAPCCTPRLPPCGAALISGPLGLNSRRRAEPPWASAAAGEMGALGSSTARRVGGGPACSPAALCGGQGAGAQGWGHTRAFSPHPDGPPRQLPGPVPVLRPCSGTLLRGRQGSSTGQQASTRPPVVVGQTPNTTWSAHPRGPPADAPCPPRPWCSRFLGESSLGLRTCAEASGSASRSGSCSHTPAPGRHQPLPGFPGPPCPRVPVKHRGALANPSDRRGDRGPGRLGCWEEACGQRAATAGQEEQLNTSQRLTAHQPRAGFP